MNPKLNQIQDWPVLARRAGRSVSKLAQLCGVSIRVLQQHFREARGETPKTLLAAQCQQQAWKLLCDGSTVKETAAMLGYRHAEHFSRDFKAWWGYCPTERCHRCPQAGACLKRGGRLIA